MQHLTPSNTEFKVVVEKSREKITDSKENEVKHTGEWSSAKRKVENIAEKGKQTAEYRAAERGKACVET